MRRKIAVLGGGAGSLFAVWDLVHSDPSAYDVTVYQLGWRLGGKGASGIATNTADGSQRIEEHGLHFMFGFYENVFRVVREAHEECYGSPDVWRSFFTTVDTAVSMIHFKDDTKTSWESWDLPYPAERLDVSSPGAGGSADVSIGEILKNLWAWSSRLLENEGADRQLPRLPIHEFQRRGAPSKPNAPPLSWKQARLVDLRRGIDDGLVSDGNPAVTTRSDYATMATALIDVIEREGANAATDGDVARYDALAKGMEAELVKTLSASSPDRLKRPSPGLIALVKFMKVVMTGIFKDLFVRGKDWWGIDQIGFNEWIRNHGGDPTTPAARGLIEAVFATNVDISASALLQSWLKAMFLFRGGAMFKMQAGMGDTIFAPIYRVLKETYDVKFEFFHRVEDVLPGQGDDDTIKKIVLERQVVGASSYEPLVETPVVIGGQKLWCWPNAPLYDRLPPAEGKRLQDNAIDLENHWTKKAPKERLLVLEHGTDFHEVILGISVAALPSICSSLLDRDEAFRAHVRALATTTTATQAMQIWLRPGKAPPADKKPNPIVVPYTTPYDTIAKMTQLEIAENWPANAIGGVYYLCSALREDAPPPGREASAYPDTILRTAKKNGLAWLAERAPTLWKHAQTPTGEFDVDVLYDPNNGTTLEQRFTAQYVNTPRNLSDRYVIPVPGSFKLRLASNGTIFGNLFLAGDWVRTSLSIGCLEAAAMSGIQAARALSLETSNKAVERAHGEWIEEAPLRPRIQTLALLHRADELRKPRYRYRDGESFTPPPYQISCDDLFMFYVAADSRALQSICDRDINVGPTVYRPLGDFVIIYGANIGNATLGTRTSTNEMGVWVPVLSSDGKLCIYSPYVWIDSSRSAFVGRTVFGYTKQNAQVSVPNDGEPLILEIVGDVFVGGTGEQGISMQQGSVLRAAPATSTKWKRPAPHDNERWLGLVKMAYSLATKLKVESVPSPAALVSLLGGMRSVFLKQLPDASATKLEYQALIEASIVPRTAGVMGKLLEGDWTIDVPPYFEPDLVRNLGLEVVTTMDASGSYSQRIYPIEKVWVRFDGTIDKGVETWRAAP